MGVDDPDMEVRVFRRTVFFFLAAAKRTDSALSAFFFSLRSAFACSAAWVRAALLIAFAPVGSSSADSPSDSGSSSDSDSDSDDSVGFYGSVRQVLNKECVSQLPRLCHKFFFPIASALQIRYLYLECENKVDQSLHIQHIQPAGSSGLRSLPLPPGLDKPAEPNASHQPALLLFQARLL